MAEQVSFEKGLVEKRISGETLRATLARLLKVRWHRAKRWITSPDPLCTNEESRRDRLMRVAEANSWWALGFCEECRWSRLALPTLNSWT